MEQLATSQRQTFLARHDAGVGLVNAALVGGGPVVIYLLALTSPTLEAKLVWELISLLVLVGGAVLAGFLMRYPENGRPYAITALVLVSIHVFFGFIGFYILFGVEQLGT
jgi:hypothetical protein